MMDLQELKRIAESGGDAEFEATFTHETVLALIRELEEARRMPEAYVLAPIDPTPEMRLAGKHALKGAADLLYESEQAICVYGAMIDAARQQKS